MSDEGSIFPKSRVVAKAGRPLAPPPAPKTKNNGRGWQREGVCDRLVFVARTPVSRVVRRGAGRRHEVQV